LQDELVALEKLQTLDLQILEHRAELESIPKNLEAMRSDVASVRDLLEREKTRLAEAEKWRADREREIAIQTELLNKSKAKLQLARNEKEAKAAQREIDTVRKSIQEREEEALKVMEAIDQYRKAIEEHGGEFAELEGHLRASETEGEARMGEIQKQIASDESSRVELAKHVPEQTLRLYERIHRRHGRAVVEAVDGCCTGCNLAPPPQIYNEVLAGEKLLQCPNCQRILIFKGDPREGDHPGE
jgi:predicted  nucleic acid-binding Zn-ribbon protein